MSDRDERRRHTAVRGGDSARRFGPSQVAAAGGTALDPGAEFRELCSDARTLHGASLVAPGDQIVVALDGESKGCCEGARVVVDVHGEGEGPARHWPVGHDERSAGFDSLVRGTHHRARVGAERDDGVCLVEDGVVVGRSEEPGEHHVGWRARHQPLRCIGWIASDDDDEPRHLARGLDERLDRLVGREAGRAEHHARNLSLDRLSPGTLWARCLVDHERASALGLDDRCPVLAGDQRELRSAHPEAPQGLQLGRELITLCAEAPGVAVDRHAHPQRPTDEHREARSDHRWSGDDERFRPFTAKQPKRPPGRPEVAQRRSGAPRAPRVPREPLPPDGGGKLLGPTPDPAPRDEDGRGAALRLSVIVASRNRRHVLERLVGSVLADPVVDELVVVLDGPDDASDELVCGLARHEPRLVALVVEHRGQLGALEAGVVRATGDVVVLIDDDVLPTLGLFAGHLAHHERAQGLVVMGSMPLTPSAEATLYGSLYAREYAATIQRLERGEAGVLDHLWLGNVSLRRRDYDAWSPLLEARRQDDEQNLIAIVRSERLAVAGLVPSLGLRYARIDSNVGWLYSHDRSLLSLKWERAF